MPSLRNTYFLTGFTFVALFSSFALAETAKYAELKSGDTISVNLDQLLPTQAVLSYDREFAKLGLYAKDLKQMYNDLCKANGAGGVKKWNEDSQPTDASSYQCINKPGTRMNELSTVVVGPEAKGLYLTRGHHILSTFWDMPNGGTSVPVMVKVTHNLLDAGDDFWPQLNKDQEVWLINAKGKKIKADDLPEYIGLKQLKHDKYLSLVYFLNGISYTYPDSKKEKKTAEGASPIPFFELNWALAIRKHMNVSDYDLNEPEEYAAALAEAATVMIDIADDEVIGHSHLTAKEMGKFKSVDSKALEALLTDQNSEFTFAMAYRLARKEKSTPKRLLEEEAEEKEKEKEQDKDKKASTDRQSVSDDAKNKKKLILIALSLLASLNDDTPKHRP